MDSTLLIINSELRLPQSELQYRFARSGGPGGQHVKKCWPSAPARAFRAMCPSGNSTTIPTGWSISSMASFATCHPSSRQRTAAPNPFYQHLICSAHKSRPGSGVSPAFNHLLLFHRDQQRRGRAVFLSWCATRMDACWLRLARPGFPSTVSTRRARNQTAENLARHRGPRTRILDDC